MEQGQPAVQPHHSFSADDQFRIFDNKGVRDDLRKSGNCTHLLFSSAHHWHTASNTLLQGECGS